MNSTEEKSTILIDGDSRTIWNAITDPHNFLSGMFLAHVGISPI